MRLSFHKSETNLHGRCSSNGEHGCISRVSHEAEQHEAGEKYLAEPDCIMFLVKSDRNHNFNALRVGHTLSLENWPMNAYETKNSWQQEILIGTQIIASLGKRSLYPGTQQCWLDLPQSVYTWWYQLLLRIRCRHSNYWQLRTRVTPICQCAA